MAAEYICTTNPDDFQSWTWFQEYRAMRAKSDAYLAAGGKPIISPKIYAEPLPVELGLQFSEWVMATPEVRDMVYRRFVCGDYDNEREGALLRDAEEYFKEKHTEGYGSFGAIWSALEKVILGEITSTHSQEYENLILTFSWAFTSEQ